MVYIFRPLINFQRSEVSCLSETSVYSGDSTWSLFSNLISFHGNPVHLGISELGMSPQDQPVRDMATEPSPFSRWVLEGSLRWLSSEGAGHQA